MRCYADRNVAAIGLATAALLTGTCNSPTLPSKTTIIPPPAIACPAAPSPATTTNGQSAAVTYGSPIVTGGSAPVSASCAPSSGSTFNLGATPITCTAVDAAHRTASCSFAATVILPLPHLGVTTILAFGDSMTEGEVPVAGEFSVRPQFVEPARAYPADLAALLAQRYTVQGATSIDAFTLHPDNSPDCATDPPRPTAAGIVVINAGCLGESPEDPMALARLSDKLAAYHPDVVLLLEGVNGLDDSNSAASISAGVQGVRTLILAAQARGARVIVATLPPQIAMDLTHGGTPDLILPFNAQLVPMATGAGASVVDLYSDIASDVTDWVSPFDGLHLTEAGYQEVARVWFNSIQKTFELPPPSPTTNGAKATRGR